MSRGDGIYSVCVLTAGAATTPGLLDGPLWAVAVGAVAFGVSTLAAVMLLVRADLGDR